MIELRIYNGAAIVIILLGATLLAGCTVDDSSCARAFENAARSVDEVVAAEFSCTQGPESSTQGGIITFSVQTDEEAVPVMGEVYRAFAASSELDSGWATNATFFPEGADTTDAQESFDDTGLGFSGAPRIYELRDHYDIHPTGTE